MNKRQQKIMQRVMIFLINSFFCFSALIGISQQVADTLFSPEVSNPVFSSGQGSVIMIDEAHAQMKKYF